MTKTVVCIHTVPLLIKVINDLKPRYLPDIDLIHVINEVLVEQVRIKGISGQEEKKWLIEQVNKAISQQASAVLVTCTILSGFVEDLRSMVEIPILRIDEEMAKEAVSIGKHIGIIVTNPDSIPPSTELLEDYAKKVQKSIILHPIIAENAFEAIRTGHGEIHDLIVINKITELSKNVDVIVLAQASMARVLDALPESGRPVPVLSSPILSILKLQEILRTE